MAIQFPEGEREFANVAFQRESPMAIGITDRAVYVADKVRRSFRTHWHIRRIPMSCCGRSSRSVPAGSSVCGAQKKNGAHRIRRR